MRHVHRLFSRNGKDVTSGYPELAGLHDRLVALDAVVDGEIVAFQDGRPSFQSLQQRMHVREPRVEALAKRIPVVFMAFDLLHLDGRTSRTSRAAATRGPEEILVPDDHVQLSPSSKGPASSVSGHGRALEGIVAKRLDSRYETGARSRAWLKVKLTFDADVVIVGWTEGEGRRRGRIGSLVMAVYDSEGIRYVGNVGTGFDRAALEDAARRLEAIETSDPPFDRSVIRSSPELRRAHWVEPRLVAVVEHRQLTDAGRLRASFKGWRDDKAPQECTFDQLQPAPPRENPEHAPGTYSPGRTAPPADALTVVARNLPGRRDPAALPIRWRRSFADHGGEHATDRVRQTAVRRQPTALSWPAASARRS